MRHNVAETLANMSEKEKDRIAAQVLELVRRIMEDAPREEAGLEPVHDSPTYRELERLSKETR